MRRPTRVRGGAAAAVALAMVLGGPALGAAAGQTSQSAAAAQGLDVNVGGWAENVLPLPDGDVLVSNLGRGLVQRVDGTTHEITTVAEVSGPGGLAVDGSTLYVVTGNAPGSVLRPEGGVLAIDLDTGEERTVVGGLGQANGLARLPDGDLVLTVTLGRGTGVHRIDPDTGESRLLTTSVPSPNGLAVGPDGQAYVGSTFLGTITRVDPDTGQHAKVAGISAIVDDFGFRDNGRVVAATIPGFVDELDIETGSSRPLAAGFFGATSARAAPGGGIVVSTVTGRVVTIDG